MDDVERESRAEDNAVSREFPWFDAAILLAVSTAMFVLFPEPLWRATRVEGHLARFVVSYLAVIPLAMALRARHAKARFDLAALVGSVWGAKLVVTVVLYHVLVTSRRAQLVAPEGETKADTHAAYAALDAFAAGDLDGVIVARGAPVAGAIVALCEIDAGRAPERAIVRIAIAGGNPGVPFVDATVGDRVEISTTDDRPHAVRIGALSVATVPNGGLGGGTLDAEGVAILAIDGAARGAVHVFAHPYHARTDGLGAFAIARIPVGPHRLCVFTGADATPRRAVPFDVRPDARSTLRVDLSLLD